MRILQAQHFGDNFLLSTSNPKMFYKFFFRLSVERHLKKDTHYYRKMLTFLHFLYEKHVYTYERIFQLNNIKGNGGVIFKCCYL